MVNFGLYSATARHAALPNPTAAEEAWYTREFPYYAELAALSEIRKKPGFDVPLRSGIGGHSLLYLNGVSRDRQAGYPVLKLGPGGVGISVNSHYRNANWVAADGPDFLWRGALAQGESLTRDSYARTQARAKTLGILDGIEFHDRFFAEKPKTMAPHDFMYEISVGTDYAAQFGRDIFRARVPLDRPRMQAIIDYLNSLNTPYRNGGKIFNWKLFNNNCCHVAHNALAAAGIWSPWLTGKFFATAAFNFPVPKNEFVDLVRRADDLPGAIVIASPAIRGNEVYDTEGLKLIFYDNPFWGQYSKHLKRILTEPRYSNLRANLQHFATVYANAQVNISHAKNAAKIADLLKSLDQHDKMPVEITA